MGVCFRTAPPQLVLIGYSVRSAAHYVAAHKKLVCKASGKKRSRWVSAMTKPLKEMTMKKLSIVLLAGIATLVAVTEPSLAAQRKHRAFDAYARGGVTESVGPQYSGQIRSEALTPAQHTYMPGNGPNLPYPDRAYGDPDRW